MTNTPLIINGVAIAGMSMTVPLFPSTSRYYAVPTSTLELSDWPTGFYLQRRFVPAPDRFELLVEHVVVQGERLDNLTAHYLGDPEQFWRVCDANNAMHPNDLTATTGRRLRITLPEGIPGNPHA